MRPNRDSLKALIARVCGCAAASLPDAARLGEPPEWDSLAHLALMVAVGEAFGREISPAEMARLTSLPALEGWLAAGQPSSDASPAPTVAQIADALRAAGLRTGDVAMVHSSTPALGIAERPDRALIDALLEVLGPEGTLILPAFTYSFCRTGVFEPERSPSEVGVAADALRAEYAGMRSGCPIFSVVALGARAEEVAALHPASTFGPDSIFGWLVRSGGKICTVGVGYERATLNHLSEQEAAVPYRYWKRFEGVVRREGADEPVGVDYFVRSLQPEAEQDFAPVHRLIAAESFSGRAAVGGAEISCAPAAEYHHALREALARDPLMLLTARARRHWEPDPAAASQAMAQEAVAAGDYASLTGGCRGARALLPAEHAEPGAVVRVAWTGSGTLEPLAEAAECHARAQGLVPLTSVGGFGQFRRDLTEGLADAEMLFVRVLPESLAPGLDGWRYAGGDPAIARAAARQLGALVRGWLERSSGHAVIHIPAVGLRPATGIADAELPDGARAVAAAFAEELAAFAREVTRAHVLDETAVLLRAGARAEDTSLRLHAGLELSGPAIAAVGGEASRFIVATRRRPIKCLVTDLDNTIWGGIVGEDGVAGLSLAGEFAGEAHRELQRWLLAHHRAGVLLAICSRNEPADALAPFDERPDMILRREHFAAISVDWRPKPERLLEIARELNIGADAIAFLDDSPFERAAVREALPEVTVPELPADVARWVEHLGGLHLTDALTLTEEDRRRAAMYAEDRGRRDLAGAVGDMHAFLSDLESVATLGFDEPALTARTAQLCARTNQFNLSAHRHSEGRIARFIADPHARVIQMRASDRFGDLGITGIAIVTADGARAHLDTFLISCRALGRGFEEALLAEAWRVAEERFGARELHAQWLDTGRNAQVREFLQRIGAREGQLRDGAADFVIDRPVAWPEHIRRREA